MHVFRQNFWHSRKIAIFFQNCYVQKWKTSASELRRVLITDKLCFLKLIYNYKKESFYNVIFLSIFWHSCQKHPLWKEKKLYIIVFILQTSNYFPYILAKSIYEVFIDWNIASSTHLYKFNKNETLKSYHLLFTLQHWQKAKVAKGQWILLQTKFKAIRNFAHSIFTHIHVQ